MVPASGEGFGGPPLQFQNCLRYRHQNYTFRIMYSLFPTSGHIFDEGLNRLMRRRKKTEVFSSTHFPALSGKRKEP